MCRSGGVELITTVKQSEPCRMLSRRPVLRFKHQCGECRRRQCCLSHWSRHSWRERSKCHGCSAWAVQPRPLLLPTLLPRSSHPPVLLPAPRFFRRFYQTSAASGEVAIRKSVYLVFSEGNLRQCIPGTEITCRRACARRDARIQRAEACQVVLAQHIQRA